MPGNHQGNRKLSATDGVFIPTRNKRLYQNLERDTSGDRRHFFSVAVQLSTTVMGETTAPVARLTRNRWPSRLGT
jgi:hypothetical protein